MAIYSEEEHEKFRARWAGKEDLVDEVIKILKGDKPVVHQDYEEAEKRLREANHMLKNNIGEYREGKFRYKYDKDSIAIDLRGVDLHKKNCRNILLAGAQLEGAFLLGTHLEGANLFEAHLEGAHLSFARLKGAFMYQAHLQGAKLWKTNLEDVDLRYAHIEEAKLIEAELKGANLTGVAYNDETEFQYIDTSRINRSTNPQLARDIEDYQFLDYFRGKHPRFYKVWLWSSDCGRSISRWAILSGAIALLWGILYLLVGQGAFDFKGGEEGWSWFAPFYYSIVTFATLGFGGLTPKIGLWALQILVTIEVVIGYIMFAGLISILANKVARRS